MNKISRQIARWKLRLWQKKFNTKKKPAMTSPNKRRQRLRKKITSLLTVVFFLFLAMGFGLFAFYAKDLPDPKKLEDRKMAESTKIYDRTGETLLYEIHGEEKRTAVSLSEISPKLINATLAIEDTNFYHHFGVDLKGMVRGAWLSLTGQPLQSGSTITQQFIKNSILTSEKTFSRKIKEVILAFEFEIRYSKDQILEFYFNQIPYGSNLYGAEAAAQGIFNKSAKDLSLAEAATLAALPRAPSYYSPYGSHPEALKGRQEYILTRMAKLGMVSEQEAENAKKEELKFAQHQYGIKAPHFVMYIKEYLEEKYGQDFIEKSGFSVYTTLDWDLQQAAEQAVVEGAKRNETRYNANNAALVALDPKTGQILAMVGSRDYFDLENDGNVNVTLRSRQPGSSFKPIVYATALQRGFTPQTILFDVPTNFSDDPNNPYSPQNYDGVFRGPVSLKSALAQSLNIPAVKTLYLAGLKEVLEQARQMGFTTFEDEDRFGLSLVLGGGEVKLIEETAAFSIFATEGIKNETASILKIVDKNGETVEEFEPESKNVLDKQVARQINDILSDNSAREPVFGTSSHLNLGNITAAAKTGTTNEYRDAWTVGYTPSLVAGVWVGNNNNAKMYQAPGAAAAAPIWNQFMKQAYKTKREAEDEKKEKENYFLLPEDNESFVSPEPVESDKPMLNGQAFEEYTVDIDSLSGKLATDFTPPELIEKRTYKRAHTILYFVDKDEPAGPQPENPADDPQFNNWESGVISWLQESCQQNQENCFVNEEPPSEEDDLHTGQTAPQVEIINPQQNQTLAGENLSVQIRNLSSSTIKQVDFFLDDALVLSKYGFYTNLTLPIKGLSEGRHELRVKVYDELLNRGEANVSFWYQK